MKPRGRLQGLQWITRFGTAMEHSQLKLQGEIITTLSPTVAAINSAHFYNQRPDYIINDDQLPRRPRVISSSGINNNIGPLIGEHYVSRYYGTIDIPEAGTYEFCAHANAGYHYVGMDMVKQGGTKHPGPYGQTLIGFDAGKYSKRRRSNVAVIIVRVLCIS